MARLSVTFLGTSSATPTRSRSLPSILIHREGEVILLDSGEGVQRELMKQRGSLSRLSKVLITHIHGDHVIGMIGLLQTLTLSQRTQPLTIVAPEELVRWLRSSFRLLRIGLTFDIRFVLAKSGLRLKEREYTIRAAAANHSVRSFSYVLLEKSRPGLFDPAKARALKIPEGKLWSRLQRGRPARVGRETHHPSEVLGPPRPGRKVGYSGDTRPSAGLARFFHDCDLLIFDSTFLDRDRAKAIERRHSTSREAASLAKRASVKRLALTHFSARYRNVSRLLKEAREIFPETIAAKDGLRIEVPYRDSG